MVLLDTYCIYLRKSRADAEAEARGEGETLARHEHTLCDLAKRQKLHISKIYREIVSGETIAARPQMQQLLQDVESGIYAGVLVMEVERLARGDTIDQGIVAQAFKYSGTKIVTPTKTYDPDNEFDEEYFEFSLFMSRREYKTIKRRMQAGRAAAAKEGKFVGNIPPYGYDRKKLDHDSGFMLVPNEKAKIVKMIFEWYTVGVVMPDGTRQRIGTTHIANRLHQMGIKTPRGGRWNNYSVRSILLNPVYCGVIRWGYRRGKSKLQNGVVTKTRPTAEDGYIEAKGLHEPIISQEAYETAQELAHAAAKIPKVKLGGALKNPLAGIVVCRKCGKSMGRQPYTSEKYSGEMLICKNPDCRCVSSDIHIVEQRLLDSLAEWLHQYEVQWQEHTLQATAAEPKDDQTAVLEDLRKEQAKAKAQLAKAYDLLEQEIYDTNTFVERSSILKAKISDLQDSIDHIEKSVREMSSRDDDMQKIIPKVKHILEVYSTLPDASAKNQLLKEVLEKAEYSKDHSTRWHGNPDNFDLVIFPKLPR